MKKKYSVSSKDKKDWVDFTKKMDGIFVKEDDSLQENREKNMFKRFSDVIDERKNKQHKYETTFIGLKSTKILEFKKIENIYS